MVPSDLDYAPTAYGRLYRNFHQAIAACVEEICREGGADAANSFTVTDWSDYERHDYIFRVEGECWTFWLHYVEAIGEKNWACKAHRPEGAVDCLGEG